MSLEETEITAERRTSTWRIVANTWQPVAVIYPLAQTPPNTGLFSPDDGQPALSTTIKRFCRWPALTATVEGCFSCVRVGKRATHVA